jgi:hypothetical protein
MMPLLSVVLWYARSKPEEPAPELAATWVKDTEALREMSHCIGRADAEHPQVLSGAVGVRVGLSSTSSDHAMLVSFGYIIRLSFGDGDPASQNFTNFLRRPGTYRLRQYPNIKALDKCVSKCY